MDKQIDKRIDYAINVYLGSKNNSPSIILLNKKDYKDWCFKLKFSLHGHFMTFTEKLKDHKLKYRGIRVICSKQIEKGNVEIY